MPEIAQRRLRIFGYEPDCGGAQLVDRALRSTPGVTAVRFDEPQQEACVEFFAGAITFDEIVAALERTGLRVTESREPCPCCGAEGGFTHAAHAAKEGNGFAGAGQDDEGHPP